MKFVLNLWGHRGDKSWPGGAVKELNIRAIESEVPGGGGAPPSAVRWKVGKNRTASLIFLLQS